MDVVTPTHTHADVVERALRAGCDVVCEKPLAPDVATAQRLVDLARDAGRRLFPAHDVRYMAPYVALRAAVADGLIGSPAVSRFQRTGEFPSWAAWFADDALSGGVVFDLMIHDLDIARWVSGEVASVQATLTRTTSDGGDPLAVGQAILTHVSGALSYVRGVWGARGTSFRTSFNVAGDRGVLRHDLVEDGGFRFDAGSRAAVSMLHDGGGDENPYQGELADFLAAIRTGGPARVSASDGVEAVRLAAATARSAAEGRAVGITIDKGR